MSLIGGRAISSKFKKDQSPKKRQEILDDWNVKILPSKKKQIQIQRRNTDPRTYYRREMMICHQLQRVLGSFVTVARKQQKPEKVYENVFS